MSTTPVSPELEQRIRGALRARAANYHTTSVRVPITDLRPRPHRDRRSRRLAILAMLVRRSRSRLQRCRAASNSSYGAQTRSLPGQRRSRSGQAQDHR